MENNFGLGTQEHTDLDIECDMSGGIDSPDFCGCYWVRQGSTWRTGCPRATESAKRRPSRSMMGSFFLTNEHYPGKNKENFHTLSFPMHHRPKMVDLATPLPASLSLPFSSQGGSYIESRKRRPPYLNTIEATDGNPTLHNGSTKSSLCDKE